MIMHDKKPKKAGKNVKFSIIDYIEVYHQVKDTTNHLVEYEANSKIFYKKRKLEHKHNLNISLENIYYGFFVKGGQHKYCNLKNINRPGLRDNHSMSRMTMNEYKDGEGENKYSNNFKCCDDPLIQNEIDLLKDLNNSDVSTISKDELIEPSNKNKTTSDSSTAIQA